MNQESVYVLNPNYMLKLDKNRIIISNSSSDPTQRGFIGFIHPFYAVMLSLFDGEKKLKEEIGRIANLFKKSPAFIESILSPLLENEKSLDFEYDGHQFLLPPRLLVQKTTGIKPRIYQPQSFFISKNQLNMEPLRLFSPLDIFFVINMKCQTECIYCYADRRRKVDCQIPLERLKEIIREAKKLNMRSFDLSGGEIFLYKNWEELLAEILTNGFTPFISTKCPLGLDTIKILKNLGIKKIQISVDSLVEKELKQMVGVKANYCDEILETLKNLDDNGFEIYSSSQVTSINQYSIIQLVDRLLKFKNIRRISVGAAGFSLYKDDSNYFNYKPSLEQVKKIEEKINQLQGKYGAAININFSGYSEKETLVNVMPEEKKSIFDKRARCSGNFYGFVILPDGKVTVCEELYWHPRFIIGDLTKQSIDEVWNSDRALELYNISRDIMSENSACKMCDEFDPCHKKKGVCWKEILYAYGYENWDYPDPKCPYAPKPFREYYL